MQSHADAARARYLSKQILVVMVNKVSDGTK